MGNSSSRSRGWFNRWPNRDSTINYYNNIINVQRKEYGGKVVKLGTIKSGKNSYDKKSTAYNTEKQGYIDEIGNDGTDGNDATNREYDLDNEEGIIENTEGDILSNKAIIRQKQQYLSNELATGYSIYLTKKSVEDKEDYLIKDTKQRNLDIYNGMSHTNHSLQNTITKNMNNQTTDHSKVFYQIQQTDGVRTTNTFLLIIYLILVIAYILSLYLWSPLTGLRMKLITLIILLLFPYLTYFYYNIDLLMFLK